MLILCEKRCRRYTIFRRACSPLPGNQGHTTISCRNVSGGETSYNTDDHVPDFSCFFYPASFQTTPAILSRVSMTGHPFTTTGFTDGS